MSQLHDLVHKLHYIDGLDITAFEFSVTGEICLNILKVVVGLEDLAVGRSEELVDETIVLLLVGKVVDPVKVDDREADLLMKYVGNVIDGARVDFVPELELFDEDALFVFREEDDHTWFEVEDLDDLDVEEFLLKNASQMMFADFDARANLVEFGNLFCVGEEVEKELFERVLFWSELDVILRHELSLIALLPGVTQRH